MDVEEKEKEDLVYQYTYTTVFYPDKMSFDGFFFGFRTKIQQMWKDKVKEKQLHINQKRNLEE